MTFLKSTILMGLLLTLVACGSDPVASKDGDKGDEAGETDEGSEDEDEGDPAPSGSTKDAGSPASSGAKDAGATAPSTAKDAGAPKPEVRDSGAPTGGATDAGAAATGGDAGKSTVSTDAGQDSGGGGFTFPDLFPAAPDAGTAMGAPANGARDVNGPCKDLQLLCFDIFDMFIINPSDCFTCNGGKGCMGCAIPFAY